MLDTGVLDEIIRRIVEVAQPEKIILFGSAARGQLGSHSDLDLLVVKEVAHRRKLAGKIYQGLYGVGAAVDARTQQSWWSLPVTWIDTKTATH